jgi:hypothetical protein
MVEVTASGMTHHTDQIMGLGTPMLRIVTSNFWKDGEPFSDFNYGMLKIKKSENGDDVSVAI